MEPKKLRTNAKKYRTQMGKCLLVFFVVLAPVLAAAIYLSSPHPLPSQVLKFLAGWLIWTFIEYINHRFRMHGKGDHDHVVGYASHMNHHHHPTHIMIGSLQRAGMLLVDFGLLLLCVFTKSWLMILCGVVTGFVIYMFMHVTLHQRWSAQFFPRLQLFHIYHHCKYPDRCFGVSVIWWDLLLDTAPPKEASISPRIRNFYFGDNFSHNEVH